MRPLPTLDSVQFNSLIGWLQTTMSVLQSTVGSADFLEKATAALVQIVGLHSGRVLLLEKDEWTTAAVCNAPSKAGKMSRPSRYVLERLRREKRTFWQQPGQQNDAVSLQSVEAVVAAPILCGDGHVIGALYGERGRDDNPLAKPVGKLEAMLVELLACGVATGLSRQQQQLSLLKAQIQFEQFFTPDLARQLWEQPDLLEGRDAQVTLLFCDVRGFSRAAEKLGPAGTVRWIGDVMSELSECVLDEGGVLVDYIGDELMAMWGAPRDQPDQAARAVRAAVAMLGRLPGLTKQWHDTLGEPVGVGIGINTGLARVGNTGSRFKFKYGPLGNPVNLASRIQGLTKYLRCRLLVSAATVSRLDNRFIWRRVCKARVVNIVEPVELFEVALASEERRGFYQESEEAMHALEAGDFAMAARRAGALLLEHPGDGPLLLVLSRAAQMLMQGRNASFDPVWEPPGK
jgi:adenylate cyclase